MKDYTNKYIISFIFWVVIILIMLVLYTSPNFIIKKWQQYQLDRRFVCPEMQSEKDAESYLYKYIKFYKDNHPEITIEKLLGMRMQLLISHNCITTLQNLEGNKNAEGSI